jgi:hypothetical protein
VPGLTARSVLPIAPPPLPGELLASWFGRLACCYDAPPWALWHEVAGSAPAEFGWNDTGVAISGQLSEPLSRIAIAARLNASTVVETTASAAFPAAPATWLRSLTVSMSQIPWCPACLSGDVTDNRAPYLRKGWAAGCVVVCVQHRTPLVDTCPGCGRQADPIFRWIGGGPVLVCVQCGALLHEGRSAQTAPASFCSLVGTYADDRLLAAIAGTSWAQSMILGALRGHPVAGPRHYRLAAAAFIAFVEGLVGDLLYPLGIVRDAGPASRSWADPGGYMPAGLPARDAFAVMAAIAAMLALPDPKARGKWRGALWWRQLGAPVDLARLWTRPSEGGAVIRCDERDQSMAAGRIGAAVALTLLGDPEIAAFTAAGPGLVPPISFLERKGREHVRRNRPSGSAPAALQAGPGLFTARRAGQRSGPGRGVP